MKSIEDASSELMNHAVFALNHSMDLKKDGVDPMIPFAIVAKGNEKVIKVFAGETLEYADNRYEMTILEENPDFVVYASDTYLTSDGTKYDAVLFKAYDKTDNEVYLFAQKYKPKTDQEESEPIGNPVFLGIEPNNYFDKKTIKSPLKKNTNWWKFW